MLEEVLQLAPEFREDDNYIALKEDMEVIRDWYHERYGTKSLPPPIKMKPAVTVTDDSMRWIGAEDAADEEMTDCVQKILDITYPDDNRACVRNDSMGFPANSQVILL